MREYSRNSGAFSQCPAAGIRKIKKPLDEKNPEIANGLTRKSRLDHGYSNNDRRLAKRSNNKCDLGECSTMMVTVGSFTGCGLDDSDKSRVEAGFLWARCDPLEAVADSGHVLRSLVANRETCLGSQQIWTGGRYLGTAES